MQWQVAKELVPYPDAIKTMEQRVADILAGEQPELIWLVEHPPIYTSGTSAKQGDLIDNKGFPVYETGRGGEYTYHGPGQRVAYVMLNLTKRKKQDLRHYIFMLEQWIIDTLAHFGIEGERREGRVGIWVQHPQKGECKIAAIGVRVRRWVTYHGIAINLNPNLSHFSGIIPCGIREFGVTSCEDMQKKITLAQLDQALKKYCPFDL